MRRRILLAILLAVTVTACALGIPLGWSATAVVESRTGRGLGSRARQIAADLDDQVTNGSELDLNRVQLLVPPGGHLLVVLPDTGVRQEFGTELTGDTVSEEVPIVQHGNVILSIDAGPMRTTQTQVALLVVLMGPASMDRMTLPCW